MLKYGRCGIDGQHLGQVLLLIIVISSSQQTVAGDTGLGTSVINQLQKSPLSNVSQSQQPDLWDMWAGNQTNSLESSTSQVDTFHFFDVLSNLTSTWGAQQKAAKLPEDFSAPTRNQIQFPIIPELSLVVADFADEIQLNKSQPKTQIEEIAENKSIVPEDEEQDSPEIEDQDLISNELDSNLNSNSSDSKIQAETSKTELQQVSNQSLSSPELVIPEGWSSMNMLQSFSTAFPIKLETHENPPQSEQQNEQQQFQFIPGMQQGGYLSQQNSQQQQQQSSLVQQLDIGSNGYDTQQTALLKANMQGLGQSFEESDRNGTSASSTPVLPMPLATGQQPPLQYQSTIVLGNQQQQQQQQQYYQQQQQQQQQQSSIQVPEQQSPNLPFPLPSGSTPIPSAPVPPGLPFPIPSGATAIPSAPAPNFVSPSLVDSFRSIENMGNAIPIPTNPPSPVTTAQQQGAIPVQQQQQGQFSQQQLQQQGAVISSPPSQQSSSYSSSCSGRSDKPGQGTRCGCSNIVPQGFCACTQVFYMQQCDNPDVATPNLEVPNGYCDVTCGRCECCPSVYEQAANLNLTVFVEMLDTINLVSGGGGGGGGRGAGGSKSITDSLKNPSHTSTVFIPTDEAFRKLYEESQGQTKTEFLAKAPLLFEIAQTHVLLSLFAATADDLMAGELGTTLATQQPSAYLTLVQPQGNTQVQNLVIQAPGSEAKIIKYDVNGCHSTIHIIDEVLLSYEPDNKFG